MKLKLSELSDEVEVSIEETSTVYTVAELKSEILDLGEPHHESSNWYTIERKRWSPDASSMIESYIENESCDLYEDWDERANDCVTNEVVEKIQAILDEAFKDDYATAYWTYDKPVEIDIFPNKKTTLNLNEVMEFMKGIAPNIAEFENDSEREKFKKRKVEYAEMLRAVEEGESKRQEEMRKKGYSNRWYPDM